MPDIWCDVDTAVIVPVNVMPLLDDTDFKTIEQAVVYNSAGLALNWNFVTTAGVMTSTAVTPTDGTGVYDWSEPLANIGMYAIEIPASGGVSINNDTEGVGWFTGVATGVLPWRGPTIGFRRAALNDLLMDGGTASTNLEDFFDGTGYAGGTAKLTVDVAKWLGTAAATPTVAGVPEVDITHVNGAAQTATLDTVKADTAAILTDTGTTLDGKADQIIAAVITNAAGVDIAADIIAVKADTAAILSDTGTDGVVVAAASKTGYALSAAGIQAIWDALTSALTTVGSIGKRLVDYLTGDAFARLGAPAGASIAADIAVIEAQTDDIGAAGAGLTAVPWNAAWDAEVQSEVQDALDAILADSVPADGTRPSISQGVYMLVQFMMERAVSGTTMTVKKPDGTTTLLTLTLDDATAPTSITRTT